MPSNQLGWQDGLPRFATPLWIEKTASYTLTEADLTFDGYHRIFRMNSASTMNFTINTGLVGLAPITLVQDNSGQVTVNGTGTFRIAGAAKKTRTQYSWITIIPGGSNLYYGSGDSEA